MSDVNKERTDSQRLDALEKAARETSLFTMLTDDGFTVQNPRKTVYGPTLRAAIDAYLDAKE